MLWHGDIQNPAVFYWLAGPKGPCRCAMISCVAKCMEKHSAHVCSQARCTQTKKLVTYKREHRERVAGGKHKTTDTRGKRGKGPEMCTDMDTDTHTSTYIYIPCIYLFTHLQMPLLAWRTFRLVYVCLCIFSPQTSGFLTPRIFHWLSRLACPPYWWLTVCIGSSWIGALLSNPTWQ